MKWYFEVKERAIGKERPRWNGYHTYTPSKTKNFEEKIKYAYISKYNVNLKPTEKPIKAKITTIFMPPTSLSTKKKNSLYGEYYAKKPDTDNIAKAILDSLNKIAYKDDNQVVELEVKKYYGKEDLIQVELEEIE